jgi:hypothetical protein
MMPIIRGDKLPERLQREVLNMYVHRWTVENAKQTYRGNCPGCEQAKPFPYVCGEALPDGPHTYTREQWHAYHVPLTTDVQWLKEHAFKVNKRGELDQRQGHALPACMADEVQP